MYGILCMAASSIAVFLAHPIYYSADTKRSHNMRTQSKHYRTYRHTYTCTHFKRFVILSLFARSTFISVCLFVCANIFFYSHSDSIFSAFNVCELLTRMNFRLQCPIYEHLSSFSLEFFVTKCFFVPIWITSINWHKKQDEREKKPIRTTIFFHDNSKINRFVFFLFFQFSIVQ